MTISPAGLARAVRLANAEPYPDDVVRPKTRGDCVDAPRPCPWVSCKYHLLLEVSGETGSIKFIWPDREIDTIETCTLDVGDRGGATLDEVGKHMNITRERARQIEAAALLKLKRSRIAGNEGDE